MNRSPLLPSERETTITWAKDEDRVTISTEQRPMMRRLRKHPHATDVEEHRLSGQVVGITVTLPLGCISISEKPRRDPWRGMVRGRKRLGRGRVSHGPAAPTMQKVHL